VKKKKKKERLTTKKLGSFLPLVLVIMQFPLRVKGGRKFYSSKENAAFYLLMVVCVLAEVNNRLEVRMG
jgi:hypothetical protein